MRLHNELAVRLGAPRRPSPAAILAERVRLVLETQPGRVPWRPKLGCDLDGLVGGSMTPVWMADAEARVRAALNAGIPDVRVVRCVLRVRTTHGTRSTAPRTLPVAESSVVPFGADAMLEAELDLETSEGPVALVLDIPA